MLRGRVYIWGRFLLSLLLRLDSRGTAVLLDSRDFEDGGCS